VIADLIGSESSYHYQIFHSGTAVNRKSVFILALVAFCAPLVASAQSIGPIEVLPHESGVQKTRYIGKDATLYNYSWDMKKEGSRINYSAKGDNGKQGAKRIEWTEKSVMEIVPGDVRTLSWVKESSGAEQQTWKLEYDWTARKMKYTWTDRTTGKKDEKTVELSQKAHAGDGMHLLVRGFPFDKGPGAKISGDFVMTNGQVFAATMIFRGEERIETAFGPVDAYKIEFKLGGAIGGLAPKMFTWYTKAAPHIFLRYEGKDDGLTRPRTVNDLIKYSPEGTIAPAQSK